MRRLLFIFALIWASSGTAAECPRIISQSPYITHTLKWLGLGECIVGVSRYDQLDLPQTGGVMDPDSEAIAALAPGLMLTSNWISQEKWQAAAPPGARALRLDGFGAMAEIESNLARIGNASGLKDTEARVEKFAKRWQDLAGQVEGRGRTLVVSACGGVPYSFGKNTYIYDLFSAAGFRMVETEEKIRHLKPDAPYPNLDTLVAAFEPDWLFVLTRRDREQCAALKPRRGVGVVGLDGEPFFHPAPTLLKGLEQLVKQRERWREAEAMP